MSTNEEASPRFQVRATAESNFAWLRTRLALERTLMAWLRTAVALIGFGFTIVQFFQHLNQMEGVAPATRPQAPRELGLALIGAGVLALVISAWQYRRIVRYLRSDQFAAIAGLEARPIGLIAAQTPLLAIVVALILIGLFAFFAVLRRMV